MADLPSARRQAEEALAHKWSTGTRADGSTLEFCLRCDRIRRADDQNKPCPGPVAVTLRPAPQPEVHPLEAPFARAWDNGDDAVYDAATAPACSRSRRLRWR